MKRVCVFFIPPEYSKSSMTFKYDHKTKLSKVRLCPSNFHVKKIDDGKESFWVNHPVDPRSLYITVVPVKFVLGLILINS